MNRFTTKTQRHQELQSWCLGVLVVKKTAVERRATSRWCPVRILAALALAAASAGCLHPPPPPDFGPRGRLADPAEALRALRSRLEKVHSVRGDGRAAIRSPQGSGRLRVFVAAQAPASVRLETLGMFGQPLAVLACDGEKLSIADLEHGKFYAGLAGSAGVALLLPMRVEPADLVALLLGGPPLPADAEPVSLEVDETMRSYRLDVRADAAPQRIWIDTATLAPRRAEVPARGALSAYSAAFSEYEDDLPKVVETASADGRGSVRLSWGSREVNPALDPAVFRQEPPPGAEIIDLRE